MGWTNAIRGILERYSGAGGGTAAAPESAHEDFQQVARAAPQDVVAGGISEAFRSNQTPPFAEMLGSLFAQSDPNQKAGLLSRLLGSVGSGGLGAIPGLGSLVGSSTGQVTPEQANQVTPGQVQQIASQAERQNPSVVDEVGRFYSQHPDVVKAIGGLGLSIALQHMLRRR